MLTNTPEMISREELPSYQLARFQELLQEILPANSFWQRRFEAAGLSGKSIQSWEDFRRIPMVTKQEIVEDHARHPPYGSNLTYPLTEYSRFHQTSGTTGAPLRWLDTPKSWEWFMGCWTQIYRMAGITREDRVYFPFSFGPFIGFWAAFEGASRLGCLCIPGGGQSSQARLKMILDNQATLVCCTPTYALRLAEVAVAEEIDLAASSVKALLVAGEPGGNIPATRERIEASWGARVIDHWGMTEIGSLGIETADQPGTLTLLETECIAEIVHPETLQPTEGLGELVITNLGRTGSPLIRYRTGDLVKATNQPSPSGRQLLTLEGGILGRADDMVTIRGNNVFPSSLEEVLRRFSEVAEYRITVEVRRSMNHLKIEVEPAPLVTADQVVTMVSRAIRDSLNFQAEIIAVPAEALPRFELKGRRFFKVTEE